MPGQDNSWSLASVTQIEIIFNEQVLPGCSLPLPLCCHAQFTYVMEESIPVKLTDNKILAMPWAGGLNAAQYNTMDLNLDGKDDLVLFDRTADKVITF